MQTLAANHSRSAHLAAASATLPGRIVIGLAATAVVAAAAHVAVPLPFTPVPLTLQPLAVLGVGLALGPVAGFLTMLAYLAEGALGLPVFSPTGPGGLLQLFGPTGGYLMAYPLVAAITGGLSRGLTGKVRSFVAAFIACSVATVLLFLCGAGWLMHLAHLTWSATWIEAVAPYLPGGAIDIVIAAGVFATLHRPKRILSGAVNQTNS
jgi:biotin transport system substrate-specific component